MKIMTFNIQHAKNFLTGKIDIPLMAKAIEENGADIIVMQEVYGDYLSGDKGQAEAIADILGFRSYFAPAITLSSCKYGNALLSRYPIISAENIPVSSKDVRVAGRYFEDRCIINARIETPCGVLALIGTHFGLQPEEAKLSVERVCKITDSSIPTVFMGDLNLHPENEILLPIRALYTDSDGYFEGCNFTFPSDKPNQKIDYIFVCGNITVNSVSIPQIITADHLPIIADVSIKTDK